MDKLKGKIALITGGTSGIGAATAKYLASQGVIVIIAGRNKERGKKVSKDYGCDYVETDINGMMLMCKIFIDILSENKGVIINNASIAGLQNFISGQGYAYASSKAAVIQFTKMIAKVYAKYVRINCICPGVIDTPLYFNLDKDKMRERTPSGLLGEADDVAKTVAFLASDDARFIYGAVIPIDGGMTL